jgi:hypothetical protein
MAFNMFDTRTMMGIIEEGQRTSRTFFRDRFFSNRPTFNTQKIDFDIIGMDGRKMAPFVHPKIGGVAIDREGYRTVSYDAPEIAPMRITTVEDMMLRQPGETIYSGKSPTQRAAEQLGKDLRYLDDIITRREEVMCREAILFGKVTIKGEGYDEVINYWPDEVGEQPTTTLATKWDTAEATALIIMTDLRTIRRNMIRKAGFVPTDLICGSAVIEAIVDKLASAGEMDKRRVDLGQVDPRNMGNGVTYWGYIKDSAIDVYSYDDWFVDDDGVEKPMMPENIALLASPSVRTSLAYGCVSLIGADNVRFYEGARVPDSWVQKAAPAGRVVQIKSRPLPIVHQINGFHTIYAVGN